MILRGGIMKKVVYNKYGSSEVLTFIEEEKPSVEDKEVLVRIYATTVASGDIRQRIGSRHSLPLWPISKLAIGITKPRNPNLGFDFSGRIEAVGPGVTKFKVGDDVFGITGKGTNMEYRSIHEDGLFTQKPDNMSYVEATSVPFGAHTAHYFFEKADIKQGDTVLINGASGAVGTQAIQMAKQYGAHVTAVCSGQNHSIVKSLGADEVIDYNTEDIYKNKQYDIIFDTVGKMSYRKSNSILKKSGKLLLPVFGYRMLMMMLITSITKRRKVVCGVASESIEVLNDIRDKMATGILKPVIDREYTFDEIRAAHDYVEKGHKIGNVVINI